MTDTAQNATKKLADESIIKLAFALIFRLSPEDMEHIAKAHKKGTETGFQQGLRSQINASRDMSHAVIDAYTNLVEHDKEILRATLPNQEALTTETLQLAVLKQMREEGNAVIVFDPEELEGVCPSDVEGAMIGQFATIRDDLKIADSVRQNNDRQSN